ncbi:hypothetical protein [Glycomyces rhizosphaerae]|uniref:Lipid-A-disaccharide synthase n=1 Tax=Glycomyces rhizosphaerae TaxID=2054422 RepID=A0ABV7Q4X0_9ACTN
MPVEFGYGPLGKALHIARAIRERAGDAVRLELVASPTFQSPVGAGVFDASSVDIASAAPADATITVMNVQGVRKAAGRGGNIYVVDSLAWLWDEPLPVQHLIHTYFYQDLPLLPVPARNLAGMPRPTPVGAIGDLRETPALTAETRPRRIVISLSGLEAPGSRLGSGKIAYAPYILNALEVLVADGRLDVDDLSIFGNTAVLGRFAGERVKRAVRGGSQEAFFAAVRSADAVICPPGLTTLVECLGAGIAPKLLPPQNYSQVKLMQAFGDALDLPTMSWNSPVERWLRHAVLPEPVAAEMVRGIAALESQSAGHADPARLLALIEQAPPALDSAAVAAALGPGGGAREVADRVLSDLFRGGPPLGAVAADAFGQAHAEG